MEFYGNLIKYLTILRLPRTRLELDAIIDAHPSVGGNTTATGLTAILSADSITLPADSSGNVISFVDAVTTMTVLVGVNNDTVNWSFTRVNSAGMSSTLVGPALSVTAMSVDTGYVDITATRSGYSSLTKRFTVTKARAGTTGPPGESGGSVTPDLTAPPTPSGLTAAAGISQFTVQWTQPTFTEGHGHKATIIYAIPKDPGDPTLPTFLSTAALATVASPLNVVSIPSNPATRWHIWAKFLSNDGVLSSTPAGGTNGVTVTTGQDVSTLLTALTGAVTASQLHTTLGARINLIDGSGSLTGSVNQRIATETGARITAISTEVSDRNSAIASSAVTLSADYVARDTATLNSANTYASSYVNSYTLSTASINSAIASNITTLSAAIGNAGQNLLSNSSLEVDYDSNGVASGWSSYSNTESVTLSRVGGRLGGFAQRVSWAVTNTSTKGILTGSSLTEGGITGGVRGGWVGSKTYVVSWFARSTTGITTTMGLQWNIFPTTTVTLLNPALSSSWQRYAFKITTSASPETNGNLFLSIAYSAAVIGSVDFDDVQVQEGDLLTGYGQADQPNLAAAVQTETTARVSGDAANASAITTVQSTITNGPAALFAPFLSWEMNGSLGSWYGHPTYFASFTAGTYTSIAVASSSGDLIIRRDLSASEQFVGALYDKVRIRLRRTSGTGWDGHLYYGTVSGHGESGSYFKGIPEPVWDSNGWAVAEFDMASLTAGGSDWITSTINLLRLDLARLGNGSSGVTYEIDWIAVGARAPGVASAAVQQEISTRATQTGELYAQYTVKIDVNGYVSGFGLASTANNTGTASSTFEIRADRFAISNPAGPGAGIVSVVPFIVQTTSTTIGGVAVPAGVYMDTAYIRNGTISSAKIADLSVDNAKIANLDAAKITTGLLVAARIDSRGLTIKDNAGNVILSAGSTVVPLSSTYITPDPRWQSNLIDPTWWAPGAGFQWALNQTDVGENSIVWAAGPKGNNQAIWKCIAAGTPGAGADGGWDVNDITITPTNAFRPDVTKTYRFMVPIYRGLGSGSSYWGPTYSGVCDLNTTSVTANPYFTVANLPIGKWFLAVGYIYPAGSTGNSHLGSGFFDMTTGALYIAGTSYNWMPVTLQVGTRCYQYYASAGAIQYMAQPVVNVIDGSETPLKEFLQPTALFNSQQQWGDVNGRPASYRVVARGASDTQSPVLEGLYDAETNVLISGSARSYIVNVFSRLTGLLLSGTIYDVYGSTAQATAMASALNALGSDKIVVVRTSDEPQTNRVFGTLPAAMLRCGASSAIFGSAASFYVRGAYILVGIPGCGEGGGVEAYNGDSNNSTNAWCDVSFQIKNGNIVGASGTAIPKSLRDYAYTGDYNATYGATFGSNIFGQINSSNITTYIAGASINLAQINTASITNLAAVSAFMGNVTVNTTGSIKGGQTAYNTGTGFFLGYSGSQYKFSIGDGTNGLTWDGTGLTVKGTLSGASGTFSGSLTAQTITAANIVNGELSAPYANSTAGTSCSITVTIPSGTKTLVVQAFFGSATWTAFVQVGVGKDSNGSYVTYNGPVQGTLSSSLGSSTSEGATAVAYANPSAGTVTFTASRTTPSAVYHGVMTIVGLVNIR